LIARLVNRTQGNMMSRDAAKIVMQLVTRNAAEQDAVLTEIQSLCTEDEFNEYRLMIGKSIGAMLFEIINPIIAKYPELKPSELR
jgi:trehalose-6-phosphatase